jgi:hypothetical protein
MNFEKPKNQQAIDYRRDKMETIIHRQLYAERSLSDQELMNSEFCDGHQNILPSTYIFRWTTICRKAAEQTSEWGLGKDETQKFREEIDLREKRNVHMKAASEVKKKSAEGRRERDAVEVRAG